MFSSDVSCFAPLKSGFKSFNIFLYASEILFQTALKFKNLEFLDFGSGFKVPYKEGDVETNIEELGDKLTERFHQFCETYGSEIKLVFEPGKFLVSQAGYFLVKVNKKSRKSSLNWDLKNLHDVQ